MRKLIGHKNGKRVYATYQKDISSLASLTISGKIWRGSSLGPANYQCTPDSSDIEYWQNIAKDAGLID